MKLLDYSFIIPVYNRPEELEQLLESLAQLDFDRAFEVVVIEDGSTVSSESVCLSFRESLKIKYLFKPNSGPGDSRNYGMKRADGNYFLILDSDCLIPKQYLRVVDQQLTKHYADAFGGPDAADASFSDLQKAINYSMTSPLTTGGIRGGGEQMGKFQPRSFNMGLSKSAFESTGGFGRIHPGEDPDLSIRLWQKGYQTALFKEAYVFHKRRISWSLFYRQVNKFGKVRVILNKWHPSTTKLTYWLPLLFCLFVPLALLALLIGIPYLFALLLIYVLSIFVHASIRNGLKVGGMAVVAMFIQFYGYGSGFLISYFKINILQIEEHKAFPHLFFKL